AYSNTSRREKLEERQQEHQKFREEREKKFTQFRDERDAAFASYLEERWEAMEKLQNATTYSEPKPEQAPAQENSEKKAPEQIEEFELSGVENKPEPEKEEQPLAEEPADPVKSGSDSSPAKSGSDYKQEFVWYGATIRMPEVESLPESSDGSPEGAVAADYFSEYKKIGFKRLKQFFKNKKENLELDGWHELYFIYSTVNELVADSASSRRTKVLTTWALAQDLGYDVRLGLDDNRFYLLYHSPHSIPGTSYYTLEGKEYYVFLPARLGSPEGSVSTYDEDYHAAVKPVTPHVNKLPDLPWAGDTRQINFEFNEQNYEFELEYNKNLSKYYQSVPQVEPQYYFQPVKISGIKNSFLRQVEEEIKNKDTWTSLDFLLRLTQEGFAYKTDEEQFGRQWFMVPPDKPDHPYSDCDDRAIFYAWLVRELLDLEVAGVLWPGHLSTAVSYPGADQPRGTYVTVDGRRYVLNDPTYIGAGPGEIMDRYKNDSPRLLFP
ncbi:MAG: hypothetical protein ACQEP7_06320, partial [bacterium]